MKLFWFKTINLETNEKKSYQAFSPKDLWKKLDNKENILIQEKSFWYWYKKTE